MQEIMNAGDIAFPNLGIYLQNVPKSFSIFGFPIAYYGVIIGIGLMAGLALALYGARKTGQDTEVYWDFVLVAIVCSLVGARLYYVAFDWELYRNDLLSILNLRGGGLAIYGAVIGASVALFFFCKIKKLSFFQMADTCAPGLILGQIIGRWGNFMNREAFGGYSDGLFAMRIPLEAVSPVNEITEEMAAHITQGINYVQVHPTFLYEGMLNLVVLLLMLLYAKHKKFQGEILLLYLGGYGIVRFFVEGLRTDQLQWGATGIAVSQVLGLVLFVAAIAADAAVRLHLRKKSAQT